MVQWCSNFSQIVQRNFIALNYSKLQYLYGVARTARNKDADVIKKEKQKNGENNKRLTIKTKKRGGGIQTIERGEITWRQRYKCSGDLLVKKKRSVHINIR